MGIVLVGLVLSSCSMALSARTGKNRQRAKPRDEPVGPQEYAGAEEAGAQEPGEASRTDFLDDFAGKKRLWVITAPSYGDNYLRMMEKQIQESAGLNCRLAERDTLIVTIIQNAMMEGKIQHTTMAGQVTEQVLDSDTVTKLLHYLELQHQTFSIVILKKNLKVGARFPYPVQVEAVLEAIDNLPARKLERVARQGSLQRCKITKKRLVTKQIGDKKRRIFSPQKQRNVTSVFPSQTSDRKAAIKSKVQDILRGRSRFVIRKTSASPGGGKAIITPKIGANQEVTLKLDSQTESTKDAGEKTAAIVENKYDYKEKGRTSSSTEIKGEKTGDSSKQKGKGTKEKEKKKKKGKRGGKKSQREANSKEKTTLKEFMDQLKGKRRLLVSS